MTTIAAMLPVLASTDVQLTLQGGLIMTACIGLVLALTTFCMHRILREPDPTKHHHAPLEIDTHDRD